MAGNRGIEIRQNLKGGLEPAPEPAEGACLFLQQLRLIDAIDVRAARRHGETGLLRHFALSVTFCAPRPADRKAGVERWGDGRGCRDPEERSADMDDQGGWLWAVVDIAFVATLAAALAYGVFAWRRRSKDPTVEQVRDRATLRNYDENPPGRPPGG